MARTTKADGLLRAVDRLRCDDDFVASAYQDWAGSNLNLDRVAEKLAANMDAVVQAGLCRRPWSSNPTFAKDVAKIACHAGLEFDALIAFMREAEALRAFRSGPSTTGLLAAARDQKQKDMPGTDRG